MVVSVAKNTYPDIKTEYSLDFVRHHFTGEILIAHCPMTNCNLQLSKAT